MTKRPTINHYTSAIRRLVTMLLVAVLSTTLTAPLLGQSTCFPPHEGLPLAFAAPKIDGYVEPELGVLTSEQAEGGWKLSTRLTYMADTLRPLMAYQALKDRSQDFIYLSFDVRADETFDNEDVIVLDFRPAFSSPGHSDNERRIDIYPVLTGIGAGPAGPYDMPPVPSGAPPSSSYKIRTNRTPRKVNLLKWNMGMAKWENPIDITTPANGHLENYDIKVRSWAPSDTDNGWSVEVKLPLKGGSGGLGGGPNWPGLSNDFGFYFDVIRVCSSCPFDPNRPTATGKYNVQYSWPRSKFIQDPNADDPIVLENFEIPDSYVGEAFIGGSNCRGVRFQNGSNGVGVRDPANSSRLIDNIDGTVDATNTFVARIINDGLVKATGVKATFRIANWGIIGEDTAPWDLLPAQPGSGTNTNPTQPVDIDTGSTPTDLEVGWKINSGDRNSFKPIGPRDPHQCIWVILDSNQDVEFANSSIHDNMNVIKLSSQEEDADISGKGLPPPVSGSDHDFLLNVYQVQLFPLRDLQKGGRISLSPLSSASDAASNNERALNVSDLEREIYQRQAASKGVVTTWVWAVDGYRSAGGGLTIESQTFRNFQPVGSFGHVADHQGRAQGLDYSLSGSGLQKLGDNSYTLKVPNGGVARIHTKLQTRDGINPPNPSGFRRWGLSLHAGLSIPHGNFDNVFNPGPNFGFDLEYRVTPTFSLEGIYGFHRFNGATFNAGGGPFTVADLNLHQFSFNGKVYGSSSPVRPFFNFGGGAYVFTPGASTHGGLNLGGGVQFDVTPNFAVDGMYNFHNVFTSGSNTQFSTLQGGVRFRF